MVLSLLALMAAAVTNPMPPRAAKADPCAVAADCRYVKSYVVKDTNGEPYNVKADTQLPWFVDGALTLYPGELVVLRLEGDPQKPVVISVGKAEDIDLEAAAQELHDTLQSGQETTAVVKSDLNFQRTEADTIRVSLRQMAQTGDMILLVEDGYGRTLDYKAVMLSARRGEMETTTVCTVRDKGLMLEQWPEPIVTLRLSDFTLLDDAPPALVCD